MPSSIVPASAKTSSTVGYSLQQLGDGDYIIAMSTVSDTKDPVFVVGLEPVVVCRDKAMYVGAIPEKARKQLRMKWMGCQVDFEEFRHAFVAPSDAAMDKIRKKLHQAHPDGNFFSSVLLLDVVLEILKDEATKKDWLALHK